jgi:Fatty acid desaturase.
MSITNIRLEVMHFLEKNVDNFITQFLVPVEKIWQPTDYLPDSEKETFFEDVKRITRTGQRASLRFLGRIGRGHHHRRGFTHL